MISTFIERWYPKMNTFHLPFREMIITLDDVSALLSILMVGNNVSSNLRGRDVHKLVARTLGVTEVEAKHEVQGRSLKLEWLRSKFQGRVADACGDEVIRCSVRACLLYLIGCTLFVDTIMTRVQVGYLQCLNHLDRVQTYVWGTAALTHLYQHLGVSSRSDVQQIIDYFTLMEGWIYEHFPPLFHTGANIIIPANHASTIIYRIGRQVVLWTTGWRSRILLMCWAPTRYYVYFYIV